MAKASIKGLDEFMATLSQLEGDVHRAATKAVYDAAGLAVDVYAQEVKSLPVDQRYGTSSKQKTGPTELEKKGLIDSLGIASFVNENGNINTSVGFDGYNEAGKANQLIARSVNSGTSFMKKNPFADRANRKIRRLAKAKMAETFEREINKNIK